MTRMDQNTFNAIYRDALNALSGKRLLDLLSCIDTILNACPGAWAVREIFEKLSEDYALMLSYVERGIVDDRREEIYNDLICRADFLLACTHHSYLTSVATNYLSTIAHRANDGSDAESLFNRALASAPYDEAEAGRMYSVMSNPNTPKDIRLSLISGITLSALCIYDWRKVLILAKLAFDTDTEVCSRAAVGFVVTGISHSDRLSNVPEINGQVRLMENNGKIIELLRLIQLQLFVSSYTKRDSRKMTEEIIPGMMSAMKDMKEKDGRLSLDDIEMELNPDWDSPQHDSDVQAQMRSLIEMQQRGTDTFYTTFSNLVRHQPFWNDAANWFIPFSEHHKIFANNERSRKAVSLLRSVFSQHSLSETEKYSLALMFSALPSGSMAEQLKEHLAGIDNFPPQNDDEQKNADDTLRNAVRSCLQDLYRFVTLFRFSLPIPNVFDGTLIMQEHSLFSFLARHDKLTAAFAHFTFHEKDYQRACTLFTLMPPHLLEARDYEMWAAALYNIADYDSASEYLERALLLQPDSTWSLRLLAGAYIHTSRYHEALTTLQAWERLVPDNTTMLQNLGECYLRLAMTEQALAVFFKLHYLQPGKHSLRRVAWCSMLLGKLKQADGYYRQLLQDSPSAEDLLNAGHCALMQGSQSQAIGLYRRSLEASDKTHAEADFFSADEVLLLAEPEGERSIRISETDLHLIRDAINKVEK